MNDNVIDYSNYFADEINSLNDLISSYNDYVIKRNSLNDSKNKISNLKSQYDLTLNPSRRALYQEEINKENENINSLSKEISGYDGLSKLNNIKESLRQKLEEIKKRVITSEQMQIIENNYLAERKKLEDEIKKYETDLNEISDKIVEFNKLEEIAKKDYGKGYINMSSSDRDRYVNLQQELMNSKMYNHKINLSQASISSLNNRIAELDKEFEKKKNYYIVDSNIDNLNFLDELYYFNARINGYSLENLSKFSEDIKNFQTIYGNLNKGNGYGKDSKGPNSDNDNWRDKAEEDWLKASEEAAKRHREAEEARKEEEEIQKELEEKKNIPNPVPNPTPTPEPKKEEDGWRDKAEEDWLKASEEAAKRHREAEEARKEEEEIQKELEEKKNIPNPVPNPTPAPEPKKDTGVSRDIKFNFKELDEKYGSSEKRKNNEFNMIPGSVDMANLFRNGNSVGALLSGIDPYEKSKVGKKVSENKIVKKVVVGINSIPDKIAEKIKSKQVNSKNHKIREKLGKFRNKIRDKVSNGISIKENYIINGYFNELLDNELNEKIEKNPGYYRDICDAILKSGSNAFTDEDIKMITDIKEQAENIVDEKFNGRGSR